MLTLDARPVPDLDGPAAPTVALRVSAALAATQSRVCLVCEPGGTVLWASGSALPLLGLDPGALVGTRVDTHIDADQPTAPAFVLDADGRPRRIDVHRTDLMDDADVRGVLVEWVVHPQPIVAAHRDVLTGLLNDGGLVGAADELAAAGDEPLAVLRLRADRPLPDDVLRHVTERLRRALRADDVAARLADGDLVIVCPGHCTLADAAGLAQRLRSRVNGPVRGADGLFGVRLAGAASVGPPSALADLVRLAGDRL